MSGNKITDQQVKRHMKFRQTENQVTAAAKAGISERSARRIDKHELQPNGINRPKQSLGLTSVEILEELLQTSKRNTYVITALDAIFLQIDDEDLASERIAIAALKERLTWDYRLS